MDSTQRNERSGVNGLVGASLSANVPVKETEVGREMLNLRKNVECLGMITDRYYARLEGVSRPDEPRDESESAIPNRSTNLSKEIGNLSDQVNMNVRALERLLDRVEL